MKAIIEGIEHQILGEPTPRLIHGLYAPELAPPEIIQDYPEQLEDMYQANGRRCTTQIMAHPKYCVGYILGPETSSYHMQVAEQGGVLGSFTMNKRQHRLASELGYRAFGIWVPKS